MEWKAFNVNIVDIINIRIIYYEATILHLNFNK